MAEHIKDKYYNAQSLYDLAGRIKAEYPPFPADEFIEDCMDGTWEALALKARIRRITVTLGRHLPAEYEQALKIIDKVLDGYPAGYHNGSLVVFPDFVEVYGQEERDWQLSMQALERYTTYSTAEFAVRPFLIRQEERMMRQMALWARHDNEHVRRLASEGCRPRLPWGQALPRFQTDPTPVLSILEELKADPSPYVRKSVANNLNDISKTHPDLVVRIAREWYGKKESTDWILKHGCRTLLKNGNREALELFGFAPAGCVEADGFSLGKASVVIGGEMPFTFRIRANQAAQVRLEYGIDYVKANGKRIRKIFQISEIILGANQEKTYTKTHSFAELSTRQHYPGPHSITLIVNGTERGTLDFPVLAAP